MPKLGQELPSHTSYVWQILLAYFAGLMGPTLEHYELAEALSRIPAKQEAPSLAWECLRQFFRQIPLPRPASPSSRT